MTWMQQAVDILERLRKTHGSTFEISLNDGVVRVGYGPAHGAKIERTENGFSVSAWGHGPLMDAGTYGRVDHAAVAAFAALRVVG